jgi:oxygen-independent coproporphyrinogen-3 oxidase
MDLVEQHGHGTTLEEAVGPQDRAREALIMGLRLVEGVDAGRFQARTGGRLEDALEPDILSEALAESYISFENGRLAATKRGIKRLDALLPALVR